MPARLALGALASTIAFLLLAAPASATFHLMKVREVFTGGASGGSYIELQMYEAGQNMVNGHDVKVYSATGVMAHEFPMTGNVGSGTDQKTILIAGPGYSGPAADFTDAALDLPAAGGAACFADATPPDCVSWGNFTGDASLPNSAGTPVSPGGVTAGKALRRSIAAGCATLLEPGDDTNNSSADFSEQEPNPRRNADPVEESQCTFPNTTINSSTIPANGKTTSTSNSFTFSATPSAGASFECKLDSGAFEGCTSPKEYTSLDGDDSATGTQHTFQVRATNATGTDQSPDTRSWTVDLVKPTATITQKPADPSPGNSSAFKYSSNEASGAKFECRLTPKEVSFSVCTTQPKTYSSLADGDYTFEVRAVDAAGNVQETPTTYEWEVDNSLADTTPPETKVLSGPPDPTESTSASFTYESTEAGSTFKCKLDGEAFADCAPSGRTFEGLATGAHSFEVFAIDSSDNEDATPAGYSFTIVSVAPPPEMKPSGETPPPPAVAPDTKITSKPPAKTKDRTPTLKFKATVAGATYQCKVDKAAFKTCRSPFTTKSLVPGRHVIKVKAIAGGVADPTPASVAFKVLKPKGKK